MKVIWGLDGDYCEDTQGRTVNSSVGGRYFESVEARGSGREVGCSLAETKDELCALRASAIVKNTQSSDIF